jgi:AraC-like DNA-binding protein
MARPRQTHGILNPARGFEHFHLSRLEPSDALAPFVERYWIVRWDLTGRPPYLSETLPHPSVHVSITDGRGEVHGVGTKRFEKKLEGVGRVFGVKFTGPGFRPFVEQPVAALTDRVLAIEDVLGAAAKKLARAVSTLGDDEARDAVEAFLSARRPVASAELRLVHRLVEATRTDRAIARVEDLVQLGDVGPRALQRLFREHVGVGPKWVIRRFRIHDAAERCREGACPDWAALAQELGYFDQAHFSRDFKAQTGRTPSDYLRDCRSAAVATSSRAAAEPA